MAKLAILEDNDLMRRYLVDLLAHVGGHQVRPFAQPAELIQSLANESVDLVILDVGLGDAQLDGVAVDGLEVARRLKVTPSSPVVMLLTAHALAGDETSFLEQSGADAYASKPIRDEDDFLASVSELVAG